MVISTPQPSHQDDLEPVAQLKNWQAFVLAWAGQSARAFSELFQAPLNPDQIAGRNCENLVGGITIPVGIAGPVTINSPQPTEVLIPLATTEGALVASVARGCKVLNQAGGATVIVDKVGMSRAPVFKCRSGSAAIAFKQWLDQNLDQWQRLTAVSSQHLTLLSLSSWVRGRYVYARFVFDTDEAMGMNMVTIALQQAWAQLQGSQPDVELISLSSNVCSDKKDSLINRLYGRGYWVQVEAVISEEIVKSVLKTTPAKLLETHIAKNLIGSNVAGSFSQNMQVANVVAAIYAATGQDLAHVVEGSQASTLLEIDERGLYAAVTLPNVNVGTVGGGTQLAAQMQTRNLISSTTPVTAQMVAQVVGVAALAAELSGLAALSSQTLASAHQKLGRKAEGSP